MEKNKIIVIDEIDFLLTKDQKILYNLFEWAYQTTSKLGLILIANTMDFPEKLLAKVTSRMGNNRLIFKPYDSEQIRRIVTDRLKGCSYFNNSALTFISKKLASLNSDIRTVLDILRLAVIQHEENNPEKKSISIEVLLELWNKKTKHLDRK